MFGLKGRDTFNKPTSNIGMSVKKAGQWWLKLFPVVLWIIVFYIIVMIGYAWYSYLYQKDITDDEKGIYIDKKMSELTFKKEKFDTLKSIIIKRQEHFENQKVDYEDVFYKHEFTQDELVNDVQQKPQGKLQGDSIDAGVQ